MSRKNRPIGVFDSGIGGLSVLKELRARLPDEDFIYLGDTARLPYGTRGDETIIKYSLECADFLVRSGAKIVIAACNTASSIAGDILRKHLDVPFVGMVDASVRSVKDCGLYRSIWILGTEGTVRSGAYQRYLRGSLPLNLEINAIACPLFVPLVEEGIISGPIADLVIERYLSEIKKLNGEAVLLACTHYPILADSIGKFLGASTRVIDGGAAISIEVDQLLNQDDIKASKGNHTPRLQCFVTDAAPRVDKLARRFLSEDSIEVVVVRLNQG